MDNSKVKFALYNRYLGKRMNMKFKNMAVLATVVTGLTCVSGCSEAPSSVAVVGDREVTQEEVNSYLAYKRLSNVDQQTKDRAVEHFLDNIALVEAITKQPDFDSNRVAAELFELKKDVIISRYLNTYLEQAVSDTQVRNYYAQNQEKYQSKQAKVAHILVRVSPDADESVRQAKLTQAQQAYSRISTGEDFATVAQQLSEDRVSAAKGGQLGWVAEGAISPVFSKAVFEDLRSEQVSSPIMTEFGFHIIKLEQPPKTVRQPFESVAGNIKRILRKAAKDAELERLKKSIKIEK